jgi:serine protease Do
MRKIACWAFLNATTLSLNLLFSNFIEAAADAEYAKIGWWQISYREVDDWSGCQAAARFDDQTQLMLALIGDYSKHWTVFLSNPTWRSWIATRKRHSVVLASINPAKLWRDAWSPTAEGDGLFLVAGKELINSLADASDLAVLDANGRVLTKLNMKDSESAIKAVVNCVRDHLSSPSAQSQTKSKAPSSGTAFFVAPKVLLTNDHVVKECGTNIQVRYPNSDWHSAAILGRDETNDLAMLRTDLEGNAIVSFRVQPKLGEPIAAYGFPYAGLLSSSGNFTTGTLSALSGMDDDSRFLQTSTPVQPGNSGGPLLDMSGNVIGVVEGQLNALTMMKFADSVPQNVNFAIQAAIVVNFLAGKGQAPKTDSSTAHPNSSTAHPDLPTAEVAELAKRFTVQVYCGEMPSQTADASPAVSKTTAVPQQANPASPVEQRAKDFALSLQGLWSKPTDDVFPFLQDLYEDEVMYYGKNTTKEAVLKEKRAFALRFPEREYRPKEPISVSCGDAICTVHGLVDFRSVSPTAKIVSTGVATFEYQLLMLGTKIKIKMENGEVLSRTRERISSTSSRR